MANPHLIQLIEMAKKIQMSKQEQEQQRRSFAYGNTKIENRNITPEAIERAASAVAEEDPK
jgi:hypothetical protein